MFFFISIKTKHPFEQCIKSYQPIEIFGELKIVFDIFLEDVYLFSSVETTYTPSGLGTYQTHRLFQYSYNTVATTAAAVDIFYSSFTSY